MSRRTKVLEELVNLPIVSRPLVAAFIAIYIHISYSFERKMLPGVF